MISIRRWFRKRKTGVIADTIPLLSASTEVCNTECQMKMKAFSDFLYKSLENNTRLQKALRTWFQFSVCLDDNELITLERIQDEDGHTS